MFRLTRDVFFSLEWSFRLRAFLSAVLPVENFSNTVRYRGKRQFSHLALHSVSHINTVYRCDLASYIMVFQNRKRRATLRSRTVQ